MTLQGWLSGLIVLACALYLGWTLWRPARRQGGPTGCSGCAGCGTSGSCGAPQSVQPVRLQRRR